MNNAIDLPSVREADHVVRVSVLDLDNAVRFSWQTDGRSRKQSRQMLAIGPKASSTKLRCAAYARAPNSVDLYLSIRCQCVCPIALRRVEGKSSEEQTFKQS